MADPPAVAEPVDPGLDALVAALDASLRRRRAADLLDTLVMIEPHDTDYAARYVLVLQAVALAASLGIPAGVRLDPKEPDWPVLFVDLPGAGQVSWHLPAYPAAWDGHTTHEKYARIRAYVAASARSSAGPSSSSSVPAVPASVARGLAPPDPADPGHEHWGP